jgi:DNA ligase (NAD+)
MAKPTYDAARVATLAEDVLKHKRLYYAGKPVISDAAYDKIEDELRRLAPQHPALSVIGSDVSAAAGAKVRHDSPMLSLDKTYDEARLVEWLGDETAVGTYKVDGVSLSLIYEEGALTLAKTRGNGQVGEDVTAKVAWVTDVIPRLKTSGRVEVRGELFCTDDSFVRLSDEFHALGFDRPTSPRNIVAGLLGRKVHVDLARYFNFFAFSVTDYAGNLRFKTEMQRFEWLAAAGFRLPEPALVKSAKELGKYLEHVKEVMERGEIGLDGAVFSYDRLALHDELGNTSHHPRYKMSFKWQGQTAETTIVQVAWATSRLGIVTPVAVIEPVMLSGAQITNVTLHNAAHVKAYNLKPGDRIEIVRSGEVIPKFLQVITAAKGDYQWPQTCPSCGAPLVSDDVRLKCPNVDACPAQQLGAIINWIRCVEIEDLSDKRLQPLMDAGLVAGMADLYKLKQADLLVIPQTKEKMAQKLFDNIQKSRKTPLSNFLNGLGIEGAGQTTWEKLLAVFPDLDALLAATPEAIEAVDGFAAKSAEQIVTGLKQRRATISALLKAGVTPVAERPVSGGPLSGKVVVITGALSQPRAEVEKAIKAAGGRMGSSVSKETHAVVTDDPTSASSKMKKARELGVNVWSEADLWRHIGR